MFVVAVADAIVVLAAAAAVVVDIVFAAITF